MQPDGARYSVETYRPVGLSPGRAGLRVESLFRAHLTPPGSRAAGTDWPFARRVPLVREVGRSVAAVLRRQWGLLKSPVDLTIRGMSIRFPPRSSSTVKIWSFGCFLPHPGDSQKPALAASDRASYVGSCTVMSTPMAAFPRSTTPWRSRTWAVPSRFTAFFTVMLSLLSRGLTSAYSTRPTGSASLRGQTGPCP